MKQKQRLLACSQPPAAWHDPSATCLYFSVDPAPCSGNSLCWQYRSVSCDCLQNDCRFTTAEDLPGGDLTQPSYMCASLLINSLNSFTVKSVMQLWPGSGASPVCTTWLQKTKVPAECSALDLIAGVISADSFQNAVLIGFGVGCSKGPRAHFYTRQTGKQLLGMLTWDGSRLCRAIREV